MDFTEKANSLASKMNALTSKLDLSEELVVEGDDVIDYVEAKTQNIDLYKEEGSFSAELINLANMVEDFKYVRETLKENTENGRRVLNAVTLDLLDSDDDKRAGLIMSFAELNKAMTDNMKVYVQSYKEISNVLLNLDKIRKQEKADKPQTVNNTVNINTTESISTADMIKRLKG